MSKKEEEEGEEKKDKVVPKVTKKTFEYSRIFSIPQNMLS